MLEFTGEHNTAKIGNDNVDDATKGCTIRTAITIQDKDAPNLVGVDIGCRMPVSDIKHGDRINLEQLDNAIRKFVP